MGWGVGGQRILVVNLLQGSAIFLRVHLIGSVLVVISSLFLCVNHVIPPPPFTLLNDDCSLKHYQVLCGAQKSEKSMVHKGK